MGQKMNIGSENDVRDLSTVLNFSLQGTIYYLIKFSLIIDSSYSLSGHSDKWFRLLDHPLAPKVVAFVV